MAPSKKPNGYQMFMREYIAKEKKKGRDISMAVAQQECDMPWKSLSPEEKAKYLALAKSSPRHPQQKYTSEGIPVALVTSEQMRRQEEELRINDEIIGLIQFLNRGSTLEEHPFYIIHVNIFCVTNDNEHVPAEIALTEFNLLEGISSCYHALINPGQMPTAYMYDALRISKSTHVIPVPPYDDNLECCDMMSCERVFHQVKEWLEVRRDVNKRLPLLFALRENVSTVKGVFRSLARAAYDSDLDVRVGDVTKLLFHLKNKCVESGAMPTAKFPIINAAYEEIQRDVHCYTTNLACDFHSTNDACVDKFHYCSLSYVKRLAFYVCDHCCEHLEIDLQPGVHCPEQTDTSVNTLSGASGYTPYPAEPEGAGRSDYEASTSYAESEADDDWFKTARGSRAGRSYGRGLPPPR